MPDSLNWMESHQLCVVMWTSPKCVTSLPPVLQNLVPVHTPSAALSPFPRKEPNSASLHFFLRRNWAVQSFTVTGTSFLLKLLEISLFLICSSTGSRSSSQLKAFCEPWVTAGLYWQAKNHFECLVSVSFTGLKSVLLCIFSEGVTVTREWLLYLPVPEAMQHLVLWA